MPANITAMIAGGGQHCTRAWPAPTNVNLMAVTQHVRMRQGVVRYIKHRAYLPF